jgi:hypothetical protein
VFYKEVVNVLLIIAGMQQPATSSELGFNCSASLFFNFGFFVGCADRGKWRTKDNQ